MPINIVEVCDICKEETGRLWRLSSDTWVCEDCLEHDVDTEDEVKLNKIKRNTYSKKVTNKG